MAKSVMDYIFRWIEARFVTGQQYDLFENMRNKPVSQPVVLEDHVAQPSATENHSGETTPPQAGLAEASVAQASSPVELVDRGIYHAADAMKSVVDMGDAPSCHICGSIMTRNGSCYRCMSCGSTSGCS
jgi:ribonucleoside-diphosphate reductase alpha chain